MANKICYEDGHLIVAAVRVLSHNTDKPPTPETIAELLNLAPDFARNAVVALGEDGILRVVENPFEIRAEVGDYSKLEELPRESAEPSIQSELEEFARKKKKEVEDTEKMFTLKEMEKKKKDRLSKMDKAMKDMKGRGHSPFK
jgi:hypothetical protein